MIRTSTAKIDVLKHVLGVGGPISDTLREVRRVNEVEGFLPQPWFLEVVDLEGAVRRHPFRLYRAKVDADYCGFWMRTEIVLSMNSCVAGVVLFLLCHVDCPDSRACSTIQDPMEIFRKRNDM